MYRTLWLSLLSLAAVATTAHAQTERSVAPRIYYGVPLSTQVNETPNVWPAWLPFVVCL